MKLQSYRIIIFILIGILSFCISSNYAEKSKLDYTTDQYEGGAFYARGEFPRPYTERIQKNPNDANNYLGRGNAYITQYYHYHDASDLINAIADYTKAIEINPKSFEAYFNRGLVYYYQKNFLKSISDYDKAIEIDSRNAEAYNNRAVSYFSKNDYVKAWADVHKMEELGFVVNPKFLNKLKKASGRDK